MKLVFSTFLIVFYSGMVFSQTTRLELSQIGIFSTEDNGQAKVYLNQDSQLKEIVLGKAHSSKEHNIWRVQIYLGSGKNSRNIANSTKGNFEAKYPEIGADVIYHSPYFKVHAGSFKTRLEAESLKKKLIGDYPNCWVISEVIKP